MEKYVTLAHGAGGQQTSALIHDIFQKYLGNPDFTADDAAVLTSPSGQLAMSTDGLSFHQVSFRVAILAN